MIRNTHRPVRIVSLALPLATLLGVAACSDTGDDGAGDTSVGVAGTDMPASAGVPSTVAPGPAGTAPVQTGPGLVTAPPGGTNPPSTPAATGPTAGTAGPGPVGPTASASAPGPSGPAPAASSGGPQPGPTATATSSGGDTAAPGPTPSNDVPVGAGGMPGPGPSEPGPSEPGPGSAEPVFHIFLLMGQSNMAGVAKAQDSDKNSDERFKVWGGCNQTARQWNTANPPLNDCPGEKGWNLSDSVDPGIWFGKTLLEKLPEGDTIGVVGTAESGQSINTFISGGMYHAMILRKINEVKDAGRFAGVIFHQGESDCNAPDWPGKVVQLYNEVKTEFGVDYDVPFILGEIPAGNAGCFSHNEKIHQAAEELPMGYWVSQEGTAIMDEYHFDHPSVVLMGTRYGEKMIEALGW